MNGSKILWIIALVIIIILIVSWISSNSTPSTPSNPPPLQEIINHHHHTESTNGFVTYLKNNSFRSGTLRIKKPGTYVLTENIIFNPIYPSKRSDVPINGFWFAGISVECEGRVVIDANGFEFKLSNQYAALNKTNVFTTILLGNNLFAGNLFGLNGSRFPDTSSYFAAEDVTIENMRVTYTTHFGIRGSQNENVTIRGCHFENYHITAIALQGPINVTIDHCDFRGSTIPIPTVGNQTTLSLLRQTLVSMVGNNVTGAQYELDSLDYWVDTNPLRFTSDALLPGTLYAIFISAGATAVFRIPMNSATNEFSQIIAGGRECENVLITNCTFKDLIISPTEKISVGTNIPQPPNTPPFPGIPLPVFLMSLFGSFGQIQWQDIFPDGTFAPNAFAHALAFIGDQAYPTIGPAQGLVPANTPDIFTSILNSDETMFNNNAAPMVGFDGDLIKGLFGIRAVGVTNLTMDNIFMENFQNIGPSAIDPTTLPGYGSITPQPVVRNRQNDVWFASIEVCENVKITNSYWDGISSEHGWVFGIANDSETHNFTVENSIMKNMTANGTATSAVEPDGQVFGYTAEQIIGGATFINVTTENLVATGGATSFPAGPGIALINAIAL